MAKPIWLNITEAAEFAGCSRKTLYRKMANGRLSFRREPNNRRYLKKQDIEKLFSVSKQSLRPVDCSNETTLQQLVTEIRRQNELLTKVISLYQPRSIGDLVKKRSIYT